MKLAASDYDGTLCRNGRVAPEDIESIKKWRQAGHLFGLATGRDLNMARHAVEAWAFDFDFLICASGAAIYDHNLNPICLSRLKDGIAAEVFSHKMAETSLHLELSTVDNTYVEVKSPDSWFPGLGVPFVAIDNKTALTMTDLVQISLTYYTPGEAQAAAAAVSRDFGDYLTPNQNGYCLDITAKGLDKAVGIHKLIETAQWPVKKVITIGDGENDLPMMRHWGGFTVNTAQPHIINQAAKAFDSVGRMLEDHL